MCHAAGVEDRGGAAAHAHEASRRHLMDLFVTGRLSEDEWARRLFAALDRAYTPAELMRIHDAWLAPEYAGAERLVEDLHGAGVATACLSNTNHSHWVRLVHHDGRAALAGAPEFPAVQRLGRHHASHLLGLAKPDPAIYRAFEAANGVAGGEILFFDDLPENVEAAHAVGWRVEAVDPHVDTTAPQLREHLRRHGVL